MDDTDINILLEMGVWVQVNPVTLNNKEMWNCIIYKKPKNNWITDKVKSFKSPNKCYDWALSILTINY